MKERLRYIISPAKQMCEAEWDLPLTVPAFAGEAHELTGILKGMSAQELQALWKCSDAVAAEALAYLENSPLGGAEPARVATPALLAYVGQQYQLLAPQVLDTQARAYLVEHLRVLSGLYGVLRPTDGIYPYRLEMQARLAGAWGKTLYAYWGPRLAEALLADDGAAQPDATKYTTIVNLASNEYGKAVLPYLPKDVQVVTIELVPARAKERKAYHAPVSLKQARGLFLRWCAEQGIGHAADVASFDAGGFSLQEKRSDALVFAQV